MADQLALLTEAHNRGILPADKEALYQEAVRRGLIPGSQKQGPQAASYIASDTGKPVIVDPSQNPAAFAAQQGTAAQNVGAGYGAETKNMVQSLMDAIQKGSGALTPGGAGALIAPSAPNPDQQAQDQLFANSTAAKVGRFGADVINTAPAAMVGGEAVAPVANMVKGAGFAPSVARAAIAGAGQGGGAAAVMPADDMIERLKNMGTGALAGGAFSGTLTGVGKGLGGVKSALTTQTSPDIEALQSIADKNQVPLSYGDVTGNPFVKKTEVGLEKVPFSGMGDFRARQAQALSDAGNKLVQGFDNTAGQDPNDLIQQAAQKLLKSNKAKAGKLFDAVQDVAGNMAPGRMTPQVQLTKTQAAAQDILGKFGGNEDLVGQQPWMKDIQAYADAQPRTFEQARKLRSTIGDIARRAQKGAATGSATDAEASAWNQLQGAVESDLQDFAGQQGGKLNQAYRAAQDFYKENVVPFKDRQLRNLTTGKMDTDTLVSTFVKNDRPQLAEKLYTNLTPEGKQTLKYAVLQKAMDQATTQGQNNGVVFSPARFAQIMDKMGETKSVLFKPDELEQVNGFAKLARAASRSGQYAENPPTGNRLADYSMAAGAAFGGITHPIAAGGTLFGANMMRRMLTTPWGKSILIRAAKTESPKALSQLAVFAANRLSQSAGIAAARKFEPQTATQQ